MTKKVDNFLYNVLSFLGDLHNCHKCDKIANQINGMGKRRTFCLKYKLPLKRISWYCIDRFFGFNTAEMNEIEKQYKAGQCTLVINGVAV